MSAKGGHFIFLAEREGFEPQSYSLYKTLKIYHLATNHALLFHIGL
jgi:hypothetical protein